MKRKPKISIIIPVYNPGKYFVNCLDSLINQTLKDIEIIIVLDCPSDGSEKVAERYAENDKRIKLIYNKENIHTGLSRNKGIEIAQGEFIGFLDHDDYCETNMYELLYKKAVCEGYEVVRCNYMCIYPGNVPQKEWYKYPGFSEKISDRKWVFENVSNGQISCVIWNHIYKTDFLKKHNIRFKDSRTICSEDSIFFMEVYNLVNKLGVIPDYLYYHIFHQNNTGKSHIYRSVGNRISFFESISGFLQENGISENEILTYFSGNVMKSLYSASRQAILKLPVKKAISEISKIKNNELMMKCINYRFKKENRSDLFKSKFTILSFFFFLRLFAKK